MKTEKPLMGREKWISPFFCHPCFVDHKAAWRKASEDKHNSGWDQSVKHSAPTTPIPSPAPHKLLAEGFLFTFAKREEHKTLQSSTYGGGEQEYSHCWTVTLALTAGPAAARSLSLAISISILAWILVQSTSSCNKSECREVKLMA